MPSRRSGLEPGRDLNPIPLSLSPSVSFSSERDEDLVDTAGEVDLGPCGGRVEVRVDTGGRVNDRQMERELQKDKVFAPGGVDLSRNFQRASVLSSTRFSLFHS